MLLKNLRPADEYDRFASQALEPWDVMFVTRIRQIARDLPAGALVDIGTATVVVPVRLAADPVLKGWHFIGLDLDETMLEGGRPRIETDDLSASLAQTSSRADDAAGKSDKTFCAARDSQL